MIHQPGLLARSARRAAPLPLLVLALLLYFMLLMPTLRGGLDAREAHTLWVVHDDQPVRGAPGDALRALRSNISDFTSRLSMQPQPPLYFIKLDAWVLLAGETPLAARMWGGLYGILAVAITVAAGRQLRPAAPLLVALAAALLYAWPASYVYTYSLLLFAGAVSALALLYWLRRPSLWRALAYGLTVILIFYTHHVALVVALLHGLVVIRLDNRLIGRWGMVVTAPLLIAAGWLLVTTPDLLVILGYDTLPVTLLALLALALPFIALLIAYGLVAVGRKRLLASGGLLALVLLAMWQLQQRPDWTGALVRLEHQRSPTAVTLLAYPADHPLAHYDRNSALAAQRGTTINIGWRHFDEGEHCRLVAAIHGTPEVWLVINPEDARAPVFRALLEGLFYQEAAFTAGDILFQQYSPRAAVDPSAC